MNTLDLKVVTDGDSPQGWNKYTLLHSRKSGILQRSSKLAFIILFLGIGALLNYTRNELGSSAALNDATALPESLKATPVEVYTPVTTDKSYLRMKHTSVDLPLAWLMSFPVSTDIEVCCTKYNAARSHTQETLLLPTIIFI